MEKRRNAMHPTVLAAGYKGLTFVSGLLAKGIRLNRIISYNQAGDQSDALQKLVEVARAHGIRLEETRCPDLGNPELAFLVGWQFVLDEAPAQCITFHDSLLPEFRGYSPTVNALMRGEQRVGVTAFKPTIAIDAGPIYGSRIVNVPPAASLKEVIDLQVAAMVELALEFIEQAGRGELRSHAQDDGAASYSLWRDEFDYFVDWRRSAPDVVRGIIFVGFPYGGARAVLGDRVLIIRHAQLGPDLHFAIRQPGKVWKIEKRRALVVCGTGTVWIDEVAEVDGQPYTFSRLRSRFLTADTAWMAPFVLRG